MQTLKVSFVGPPGSGKTLLSRALCNTALSLGFNVSLKDEDYIDDLPAEDPRGLVEITCERNS